MRTGAQLCAGLNLVPGVLVEAQSSYLADGQSLLLGKSFGLRAFPFEIPTDSSNYDSSLDEMKTKRPKDLAVAAQGAKVVQYSDLDCNRHLNNTVYADMVCDLLPYEEMEEKRWRVAIYYRKEAVN